MILQDTRITEFTSGISQPHLPDGVLVRMRDVVKNYPTPDGDFCALKGISADFARGRFNGIIGKSGAGKSTLVNMITGVDYLTSGEIWVGDTPVHELDEDRMAL